MINENEDEDEENSTDRQYGELRVWDNGTEMVVARDVDDAWSVWEKSTGEKRTEYPDEEWDLVPPWRHITISADDAATLFGCTRKTLRAVEWARLNGRGPLCSTEW